MHLLETRIVAANRLAKVVDWGKIQDAALREDKPIPALEAQIHRQQTEIAGVLRCDDVFNVDELPGGDRLVLGTEGSACGVAQVARTGGAFTRAK